MQYPQIETHGPCFSRDNKRNLLVMSALGNRGAPRLQQYEVKGADIKVNVPTSFFCPEGWYTRSCPSNQHATRVKKTYEMRALTLLLCREHMQARSVNELR